MTKRSSITSVGLILALVMLALYTCEPSTHPVPSNDVGYKGPDAGPAEGNVQVEESGQRHPIGSGAKASEARLSGCLLIQRTPGSEFERPETGVVELRTGGKSIRAQVAGGRFEIASPWGGEEWSVEGVWVDHVRLRTAPRQVLRQGAPVFAYGFTGVFVFVSRVGWDSIQGLRVYRSDNDYQARNSHHPGNLQLYRQVVTPGAPYPLFLESIERYSPPYWITADGCGWATVSPSETQRDFVDVALDTGSDVIVQIDNYELSNEMRIHLTCDQRLIGTYQHVFDVSNTFRGVSPGLYEVALSFGGHAQKEFCIARSDTFEVAGKRPVTATLRMPDVAPEGRGELRVSLSVEDSAFWSDTAEFRRLKMALTQPRPSPAFLCMSSGLKKVLVSSLPRSWSVDSATHWVWALDEVPVGDYAVTIEPVGLAFPVSVAAGDVAEVECIVPPIARVLVDVLRNGDPAVEALVFVSSGNSGHTFSARPNENGAFSAVVVPGEAQLTVSVGDQVVQRSATMLRGWNHHLFELGE